MTFKTFLTASVTATLLATASMSGAASAQTYDPVIQSIVSDLSASGFSQIRIVKKSNKIEVIAVGPNGTVERSYSYTGALLREDVKSGNGTGTGIGTHTDGGIGDNGGGMDGNGGSDHNGGGMDDNGGDNGGIGGGMDDNGGGDHNGGSMDDNGGGDDDTNGGDNDNDD